MYGQTLSLSLYKTKNILYRQYLYIHIHIDIVYINIYISIYVYIFTSKHKPKEFIGLHETDFESIQN